MSATIVTPKERFRALAEDMGRNDSPARCFRCKALRPLILLDDNMVCPGCVANEDESEEGSDD